MNKIPEHVGIIMDGNRRWAKERFLPTFAGHKAGANNIEKIAEVAGNMGVKFLTVWALSTDNLVKRSKEEVEGIIKLINNIESSLDKMIQKGLKFETIGDLSKLPQESQDILEKVKEKTKNNKGITLIVALIYGGQDEIIRAIKKFIKDGGDINNLNIDSFRDYLDTGKYPKPELLIRTGGDIRHSGFLLYDSEYSEYYFTEKKWPEFDEKEFNNSIEFFNKSKRNFGK